MRVLLDTHTLIWGLCEPDRLNVKTKELLTNIDNIIFVSIASLWELQIKKSLNKTNFYLLGNNFIFDMMRID